MNTRLMLFLGPTRNERRRRMNTVSVVAITDGEAITINEGKRLVGKRGRGIGIRVCVGKNEYPLMKEVKTERPAKNAGRASH